MHVHFIAIGGSAMHNLAIALNSMGYVVTGSDDDIFEPSKSRLAQRGLLPPEMGWFPEKLDSRPDMVILGMHARADNPELHRARMLGLKVYSYPEYLYEHSRKKKRVVVGGSHGKTTITAMVLHVLKHCGIEHDYMLGAQLAGFDVMVKLSESAGIIVLEGDEYLTSVLDKRPKFHLYRPHLALISGIAWDHINVFPSWQGYLEAFSGFIDLIEPEGGLVYCREDDEVNRIVKGTRADLKKTGYGTPEFIIEDGVTSIIKGESSYPLRVIGKHNLLNIEGAKELCFHLGVDNDTFYKALISFRGADNRLELVSAGHGSAVYRDFAHSPSKVRATVNAVKEQFPTRHLVACIELHTFSSLRSDFMELYRGSLDRADTAIVYFNPRTLKSKNLPPLELINIENAFSKKGLMVFTDSEKLREELMSIEWKEKNLLLMSSGNYDNISLKEIAGGITGNC